MIRWPYALTTGFMLGGLSIYVLGDLRSFYGLPIVIVAGVFIVGGILGLSQADL